MVSGAAALLFQQNPSLTPDQVKGLLMKSATRLPQGTSTAVDPLTGEQYLITNDIFTVGAGLLNVSAARLERRSDGHGAFADGDL